MQLVDLFMSKDVVTNQESYGYLKNRMQYQLLTAGALCLASKVVEPKVSLNGTTLAAITGNVYTPQEIESVKATIMQILLERQISGPTSIQTAKHLLVLLMTHVDMDKSTWIDIQDEVRFQCECAVRDYHLSTMQRGVSAVALAAVLNAFDRIGSRVPQGDIADLLFDVDESFASRRDEVLASMERLKYLVRQVEQVGPSSMPHVILPMEEEIENE